MRGFDPAKYMRAFNARPKISEMGVGKIGYTFPSMVIMLNKSGDLYLYGEVLLQRSRLKGAKVKVWRASNGENGFSIDMSGLNYNDYKMICKFDTLEDAEVYFGCDPTDFIRIRNMKDKLTPLRRPSPPQSDGQAATGL